jgi:Zinc carboxypeptidase
MSVRLRFAAVLAAASTVLLLPAAAQAQQVTGLEVRQDDGFATLSWDPVAGATEYDIERTPVGAPGTGVVVGVWRPNRQINQDSPAFADAGFNPGDSFQWRVRARFGTEPQPYSAPVSGTTQPEFGDPATPGENLRTGWEEDNAATFTSDVEEYAYTAALDAASERVRVVEIGRTVLGRPINMFIIGYPTPKPTAEAVAGNPAALVNCNVHGNEPSSREACLIMARKLAFADDPRTLDLLSNMTVLIVPAINGDGRAANTRGNSTGQDLNRDHSLIRQPETFALAAMVRDYTPEAAFDGHEFGNSQAGDLPTLMPRHLNVAEPIFLESKDMIENWLYVNGSQDGWWYCPYGCQGGGAVGLSQETILRNTLGLKNMVSLLLEARSAGGPTRPNEAIPANNRRRKTYSALYTYDQFLDYYRQQRPEIALAIEVSRAFQRNNTDRIVFRGSYDVPAFPAPHPGEAPPPQEPPEGILDPPPCGYLLTDAQYTGPQPDGRPVADRLAAHGIKVQRRGPGQWFVPMRQDLRGLIPLLLDGEAAEEMVAAQRVAC